MTDKKFTPRQIRTAYVFLPSCRSSVLSIERCCTRALLQSHVFPDPMFVSPLSTHPFSTTLSLPPSPRPSLPPIHPSTYPPICYHHAPQSKVLLVKLDLSGNMILDRGGLAVVAALHGNPYLHSIKLRRSGIGFRTVSGLIDSLDEKKHPNLVRD